MSLHKVFWLVLFLGWLHPKSKGCIFTTTGVIAYLVLFVTIALTIYPALFTSALTKYPETILFLIQGTHSKITTTPRSYLSGILGYGLFAYSIFGFILGGILVWTYSVYNYLLTKVAAQEDGNKTKTKTKTNSETK